ncbi:barstar family protein [Streptomyces sp. GC420]|uniref:barstar family protein n=1 Tax=Streptomyces sp. GC420 TaxID=2697568 RepID=UPI0014151F1E|nr:barstar family protein [Streptomyces sp. GC420]NBM20417.1 barnase inhibitor [Streptomyces sp. GC420]
MTADPTDPTGPLAPALDAARAAGLSVAVLDLGGVRGKAEFMERCARTLGLAEWFGRNWDALADSLTDPSTYPADGRGLLLLVRGWQEYATARPQEWGTALDVFGDAVDRGRESGTGLAVLLALGHDAVKSDGS